MILNAKYLFIFVEHICRCLESPIHGLTDVYNNKVVTISYRDPKYPDGFIFEAKRLPGAIDPPNVLAPESRPSNYRPQIGFTRNIGQASLGDSGHRMVNHYSGGYKQQQQYNNDNRNFASIAPPNSYRQHSMCILYKINSRFLCVCSSTKNHFSFWFQFTAEYSIQEQLSKNHHKLIYRDEKKKKQKEQFTFKMIKYSFIAYIVFR